MTFNASSLLLDTCAAIWLANGNPLPRDVMTAIICAALADGVFVSPVSAWEIGMLSKPRNGRPALRFSPDPKTWFANLMAKTNFHPATLTPDIGIDAAYLPGDLHGDPADRLLIATARQMNLPLVTRDTRIIAYGQGGHVQVVPC